MRRSNQIRKCGWFLCWLLTAVTPALAQNLKTGGDAYILPPGSMPAWTVPVLRLVSATHVEPTTGIVLSDSGLVLVPENFAGPDDEIIVLDGGTDIIRNGRPARIEKTFAFEGLQVLVVENLSRQGVTLAATPLQQGDEILLAAFPPAELIAEGEPPLSVATTVDVFSENNRPSITDGSQMPNVTGALVDQCGNLVGVSLAADVQTMESSPATRYQWRDALLNVFGEMGIPLREFDCSVSEATEPEPVAEEPEPEEPPAPEPVAEPEGQPEEQSEEPIEEAATEEITEPEVTEEELVTEEPAPAEPLPDSLPPFEDRGSGLGRWLWLVAAILLAGLGFVIHRLRSRSRESSTGDTEPPAENAAAPVVEPEDEPEEIIPQLDSELLLTGVLRDGAEFEDSCEVSENAINVVIGRGDADLVIRSPAVSRRHVQLNGSFGELTVSDLGSSNGTSINGVPCLEGEIMFMEPGDVLVLGDAHCSLEIRPRGSDKGGTE
jgi:hypothetical protein